MRTRVLALTIILSGVVAAQTTIPGTFNHTPQQTNGSGNNGYIVSTPTISLGDGITPTVITNQDTVNVTLPQNTSLSGPAVQANNPAAVNDNVAATTTATSNADNTQTPGQASRNFDFVKAPGGASAPVVGSMEDDSVSLGEVARKVRNGKQIAKHTITNADVNAMNGAFPGTEGQTPDATGNAMANPSQQNGAVTSQQTSGGTTGAATPAYAQPSNQGPFGAPSATPNDGTKPNAQQGPGIAPRSSSRPAQHTTPPAADKQQLPESSTKLPLLAVLGSIATMAGAGYLKFR